MASWVAEMLQHQKQQITKVQSDTGRRRGGMRFASRMQKDLSLKLIAVIATFPKFSKLLIIFLFNINCDSCEGLQLDISVKVLGSVSVLIHAEEYSTSWGLFYSEFSEFFLYQRRLTPIRSDLLIGGDSDAHPIMH